MSAEQIDKLALRKEIISGTPEGNGADNHNSFDKPLQGFRLHHPQLRDIVV